MRTRTCSIFVALVVTSASSCMVFDRPLRPVPLPDPRTVDRVTVAPPDSQEAVVDDPARVERLLTFLAARNHGWHATWHTFPSPQYSIGFKRGADLVLIVWVGPDWLGVREMGTKTAPDDRIRDLPANDRAELLAILGVPADPPVTPPAAR